MRAFAEQGDLTSAAIRFQQRTEESQRNYQPAGSAPRSMTAPSRHSNPW
jgi:hypothetical protein